MNNNKSNKDDLFRGNRFFDLFDNIIEKISIFLFILLLVMVSLQVVLRNAGILSQYAVRLEPLSRYVFIVGTYMGAAVAVQKNEHIQMGIVVDRLHKKSAKLGSLVELSISIIAIGFLAVATYSLALSIIPTWTASMEGLDWMPLGAMYLFITLSFGLMLYYYIKKFISLVGEYKND